MRDVESNHPPQHRSDDDATNSDSNHEALLTSSESSLECLQHEWALPKPSKRPTGLQRFLSKQRRLVRRSRNNLLHRFATPKTSEVSSSNPHNNNHQHHESNATASTATANGDRQQLQPLFYSPLLQSLLRFRNVRNQALDDNNAFALQYPKSNEGWFATLWILRGRALDRIAFPFGVAVGHAIVYTCLQQLVFPERIVQSSETVPWSDVLLGVVLNSTLIFLLVFRLNRAADRFWTARALWGTIVAEGRMLVGGIAVHGTPIPEDNNNINDDEVARKQRQQEQHRDHALRWVLAFFLAAMESLRGRKVLDGDMFAGILLQHEVLALQNSVHRPLYAVHHVRHHIRMLCRYQYQPQQHNGSIIHRVSTHVADDDADGSVTRVTMASRTLSSLEAKLDAMMNACGGAERIRATPLPIVYVTHLRTVLLLTLLLLPYVYGPTWQWSTIAVIALSSFVWLGIEGTAREVENPFGYRVNDLPMDGYCKGMMETTIQELRLVAEHCNRASSPQTTLSTIS
jgi:ion channel-forming bestrophin family protein